jgi:Flp pilus assembly protein TadD
MWRVLPHSGGEAPAEKKSSAPIATTAVAAAEFPRDPDLKRARKLIYTLDSIPEDYALADDIVKPLLAARPNDPEVVTVAAEVSQEFLTRGFDTTQARRAQAQRLTERAVQLAPDNPDALATLGRYLMFINQQFGRAEELLRRAIELNPKEARYYRTLFYVLLLTKPAAETDAFGARMAALFPNDPLVTYDIARRYKDTNDLAAAEEWFDKTLAITPVAFAMTWKAWFLLEVHGDVEGMKAMLDRIPERQRVNGRVANLFAVHAIVTGQTTTALKLLDGIADTWLADFDFTGPKALLVGDLLRIDGRDELARVQYEAALAEIRRVQAADPTDFRPRRAEFWTLLGLGRLEEARAVLHLLAQGGTPRPYRWGMRNSWWAGPIRACLLVDDRAHAIELLKEACAEPQGRQLLHNLFRLDPRMKPWHDDAEIVALLAEPLTKDTAK